MTTGIAYDYGEKLSLGNFRAFLAIFPKLNPREINWKGKKFFPREILEDCLFL